MNIFQYYFYIFNTPFHLVSLLIVVGCILYGILVQKRYPLYTKTLISMLMCTFGHYVYEDIFIWIMGFTGRGTESLILYLAITSVLFSVIMFVNKLYPFLYMNPSFIVTLAGLLFSFGALWYTGWFHQLQLWYTGQGPPVENWLWAMSKLLGFLTWVKLIERRKAE